MKDEELILKAVEYCNDIPARVKDFLRHTEPTEPKSEFKVGQWVFYINPKRGTTAVFRVLEICLIERNRFRILASCSENNDGIWVEANNCRLCTPQEIESHLRKICDEKYIGKKVRCLFHENYSDESLQEQFVKKFSGYSPIFDELRYSDGGRWICLYKQGKWAEIIPDKRKLPKTKDEFCGMLNSFKTQYVNKNEYFKTTEFLNEYED